MIDRDEEKADRQQLLALIRELRDELKTERAYSQQLREKSVRDLRELRAVRQVIHELELKLAPPSSRRPKRSANPQTSNAPPSEREQVEATLLRGQRSVVEQLSAGMPLSQILESLCTIVEETCPGTL